MQTIRTFVFTKDETRVLERAQSLIDIGYPPRSDVLVQRSTEALARAVPDDDPRRRVLNGLRNAFDPVARPRLDLAKQVLDTLLAQVTVESEIAWWLSVSGDPDNDQVRKMADVLAAERTRQQHHVRDALDLITEALAGLTEHDDPNLLRTKHYTL